jgi:hypothetical protein
MAPMQINVQCKRPRIADDFDDSVSLQPHSTVPSFLMRVPAHPGIYELASRAVNAQAGTVFFRPIHPAGVIINLSRFDRILTEHRVRIDVADERGNWSQAVANGIRIDFYVFSVSECRFVLATSFAFAPEAFAVFSFLCSRLP